jgi:hypothetical protein
MLELCRGDRRRGPAELYHGRTGGDDGRHPGPGIRASPAVRPRLDGARRRRRRHPLHLKRPRKFTSFGRAGIFIGRLLQVYAPAPVPGATD